MNMPQETSIIEYADTARHFSRTNPVTITGSFSSTTTSGSNTYLIVGIATSSANQTVVVAGTNITSTSHYNITLTASDTVTTTWAAVSDGIFGAGQTLETPPQATQLTGSLSERIDSMLRNGEIDSRALGVFASEPALFYYTGSLYDALKLEIASLGLEAECKIRTFVDPESIRDPTIVLDCKVRGISYAELLLIWKKLSLQLFLPIPKNICKKISLRMGLTWIV
jgi:hypothetical protein